MLEKECFRQALATTLWDEFRLVDLEDVLRDLPLPLLAAPVQGLQAACQQVYLQGPALALKKAFRLASAKRVPQKAPALLSVVLAVVLLFRPVPVSGVPFQAHLLAELAEELVEVLSELGVSAAGNFLRNWVGARLDFLEAAQHRMTFQVEVQLLDKVFPKALVENASEDIYPVLWLFPDKVHLRLAVPVMAGLVQGMDRLD